MKSQTWGIYDVEMYKAKDEMAVQCKRTLMDKVASSMHGGVGSVNLPPSRRSTCASCIFKQVRLLLCGLRT